MYLCHTQDFVICNDFLMQHLDILTINIIFIFLVQSNILNYMPSIEMAMKKHPGIIHSDIATGVNREDIF